MAKLCTNGWDCDINKRVYYFTADLERQIQYFPKWQEFKRRKNESEQECKVEYSTYYLSSAGNELLSVATYKMQKDYFVDFAIEIKKKYDQKLKISLHVITALNDEECEYMKADLIENR